MFAAEYAHPAVIAASLAAPQCRETACFRDSNGQTALAHAAQKGHTETVATLLECPEVKNSASLEDSEGRDALMHAAFLGRNPETVRAMLKFPVIHESLGAQDKSGKNALMYAAAYHDEKMMRAFIEDSKLVQGSIKNIINETDNDGKTPLMLAAASHHMEPDVIKMLLTIPNIRVDAQDKQGNTMLHRVSHPEKLKALLADDRVKAVVDRKNGAGETIQSLAKRAGDHDMLRILNDSANTHNK